MIEHVVHCDGPDCAVAETVGPPPSFTANYVPSPQFWQLEPPCPVGQRLPDGWRKVDGQDLCSWECIQRLAGEEVSGAPKRA